MIFIIYGAEKKRNMISNDLNFEYKCHFIKLVSITFHLEWKSVFNHLFWYKGEKT